MKQKIKILIYLILSGITNHILADIPIVSHRYLADPGALVYNDRVYLYCSNDDENPATDDGGYQMQSIVCVSSSDLKNWTDHGIVFQVPRDAAWSGKSWAPSPVERNGKFYLYFGNGGSAIGVATSDSPTGPFVDPLDGSLVSSGTPGVLPADNIWIFDPMTFVDDDGQAYMYFGGNGEDNLRVIKLNDDMISIDGSATRFHVPYFFEAAWMHKHNGIYYFTYSTNPDNGMRIDYLTSDNPISGFTYGGIVSPQPPDNNNNNHQAIFEFKGTWYEVYHNRTVATQNKIPRTYRRNLCLDSIYHNADGSIVTMVNTADGLPQLGYMNPFVRVEAETMDDQSGIYTEVCSQGGMNVSNIDSGDWIKARGVDFGTSGPCSFTAGVACDTKYGSTQGGYIEIHLDEVDGSLIGTVPVSYTGGPDSWKNETIAVEEVTGVHDLFFVFKGEDNEEIFSFDFWYFNEKTASHDLLGINVSVEQHKIDIHSGYDSTIIKVEAIYTDGTTEDVTTASAFTFDIENIVSVSDSILKGIGFGTVTVTADFNGTTDSVKILVKDLVSEMTVSNLSADESNIQLIAGSSASIVISAVYEDGHIENITGTATYTNPHPEIATISNGVIKGVSEGEVDITISFQGKLGEAQTTVIHITVNAAYGVWLEAECGTVGSLWDINTDNSASHTEYVTIQSGNNSTDAASADASGLLSYTFDIPASGIYYIYARVICPSANDDSFWLKMDNGSFLMWNGVAGSSSWVWTYFPTSFDLSQGSHTLTISYREDGARLDKLWITNAGTELVNAGSEADNCTSIKTYEVKKQNNISLSPNPAESYVTISSNEFIDEVLVYDLTGKCIIHEAVGSDVKKYILSLELEPGVFFVEVKNNIDSEITKLVVRKNIRY
ncbi:MAG: family 43 glycosylhydrolase [Bacteroidales bacterium]|nr:family 43 glycosylhydrolase [Bacteroidales bacterium]MBN2820401.1 family 43 glycosylhydrolase [Bacteroidales bacterium]